jgi:ABC-type glycerol-3-phosphate transport system substrate-binding protein
MASDATFEKEDILPGLLAQMGGNDKRIWAYPIAIEPIVLSYSIDQFTNIGLPLPTNDWRIDAFVSALKTLKRNPGDPPPFDPAANPNELIEQGNYLLMLIAAFGGLPIDFRTDPPTIDFTLPQNVDAIRQVLDLAKTGYIRYQKTAFSRIVILEATATPTSIQPAIRSDILDIYGFRALMQRTSKNETYRMVLYPGGTQFKPLAYDVGAAYISAVTPNPEACYRWIREIVQHTELYSAMPAQRSLINDPLLATTQGADIVELYKAVDRLLTDQGIVAFPRNAGTFLTALSRNWLFRAFDNYVLNDADLAAELAKADADAKAFQTCFAQTPPYDPFDKTNSYLLAVENCASKIDPSLKGVFFR